MDNETCPSSGSNYRWFMLAQIWLIYYVFAIISSSIPPLITPMSSDLALSHSQMGVILGAMHLIYIPLAIPMGLLIDRIGVRRSILTGITLVSLSGLLQSLAVGFETLFLSVCLLGLGGPTISVGAPKAVASWFIGRDRGTASGIYLTGFITGVATATAITNTAVMPLMGTWRNTLALYGFLGFLMVCIWLLFGRERTRSQGREVASVSLRDDVRVLLRERHVWMIAVIGFSSFFVRHSLGGWLPKLLELRGMGPAKAGLLASIPSWCGLIGSTAIPRLGKTGTRKHILSVALLVQGICVFIMGTTIGPPLIASLIIYGISTYTILPLLMVALMEAPRVGARYMGVAGGLFFSIGEVGGFLGPSMVGVLLDQTGSTLPSIIALTAVVEGMLIPTLLLKENK